MLASIDQPEALRQVVFTEGVPSSGKTGPVKPDHLQPCDRRTRFDHLAQRFMPDDEIGATLRRCSVLKGDNFFIGSANPHIEHSELDVQRTGNNRLRVVDHTEPSIGWKNGKGLHSDIVGYP